MYMYMYMYVYIHIYMFMYMYIQIQYIYICLIYSDLKQPKFVYAHICIYILLDDTMLRFGNGPVLMLVVRISVVEIPLRINYSA
jgi:hypothetical protein